MSDGMRAIVVTRPGGPEVLDAQEVPAPTTGPGWLLVAVEAAPTPIRFRSTTPCSYTRRRGGGGLLLTQMVKLREAA